MMSKLLAAVLLFIGLAGSSYCTESTRPIIKITHPDMAHRLFAKALNEKNIEQLFAMYADDCVMVLGSGDMLKGRKATRRLLTKMAEAVIRVRVETIYQVRSRNIVLLRSKFHSIYMDPQGEKVDYISSGIEILEQQKDGTWQFILDHHRGGANLEMAIGKSPLPGDEPVISADGQKQPLLRTAGNLHFQ